MCGPTTATEPSTVLIVDDEPSLVEAFTTFLDDEYRVLTATTGADALEQINDDIDVVLLDRDMPGLDGNEVLAQIRDQEFTCRVAMVSGVEPDVDIVEMAFDNYLVKPVERDELVESVERLARRTTYAETIQEAFRLASRLAVLETHLSAIQLSESDEYAALRDRRETLQTDLDAVTAEFTEQDYMAEIAQLGAASD